MMHPVRLKLGELADRYANVPEPRVQALVTELINGLNDWDKQENPKIAIWFVSARTGCTCCASDNFEAGPYMTQVDAEHAAKDFHDSKRLASQYAPRGVYTVSSPCEGELLPDGRILYDDHVYNGYTERHTGW
jgi:hypothetical protein